MAERLTQGSCLCGSVVYEIAGEPGTFQYCHCSRCRKVTGSAHASNLFVKPDQFCWLYGAEHVGRYEHPEAEHYATGFCKLCGARLPWLTKSGSVVVVPAGTLDDDPGKRPTRSIFWASRAAWYESVDTLPRFDELPGS